MAVFSFLPAGFNISGGQTIDNISSSTSLGSSDNILSTQKAVKTYTDNYTEGPLGDVYYSYSESLTGTCDISQTLDFGSISYRKLIVAEFGRVDNCASTDQGSGVKYGMLSQWNGKIIFKRESENFAWTAYITAGGMCQASRIDVWSGPLGYGIYCNNSSDLTGIGTSDSRTKTIQLSGNGIGTTTNTLTINFPNTNSLTITTQILIPFTKDDTTGRNALMFSSIFAK